MLIHTVGGKPRKYGSFFFCLSIFRRASPFPGVLFYQYTTDFHRCHYKKLRRFLLRRARGSFASTSIMSLPMRAMQPHGIT